MSGIAGIIYRDGQSVNIGVLHRMLERMSHRGVDGEGYWAEGSVGLAHNMLYTTPESLQEVQPIQKGPFALVSDARIDNRSDLFGRLAIPPNKRGEVSDGELIAYAHEKWGMSAPEYLVGAYAYVLWDNRRKRAVCVRDHIGIKPLFYYNNEDLFAFASDIQALFEVPEVPRKINEERIAVHLTTVAAGQKDTFYRDVRGVEPAHVLVVSDEDVSEKRYWSLDVGREIYLASMDEYAERLQDAFFEAVRCRLRSAYPIGSALSGGLDSSSVACAARQIHLNEGKAPIHTFSCVFPGFKGGLKDKIDERRYMDEVLALGHFSPAFLEMDQYSPLQFLEPMLEHIGECFWGPNLYLHWVMYSEASKQGIRVFLDGLDGDGAISHGYGYLTELAAEGNWGEFDSLLSDVATRSDVQPGNLARKFAFPVLKGYRFVSPSQLFRTAHHLSVQYDVPLREMMSYSDPYNVIAHLKRLINTHSGQPSAAGEQLPVRADLIKQEFLQRFELRNLSLYDSEPVLTQRGLHIRQLQGPLYPDALRLTDKMSSRFGVEGRYPFFDRRLLELLVAFPPSTKLHEGWSRYIMRVAMEGILPRSIQWRSTKANLAPNYEKNIVRHDGETIQEVLENPSDALKNYVNQKALDKLVERLKRQGHDRTDLNSIYAISTLDRWLKGESV